MMLLIVAIIAAIDDMLDPILIISAADILRFSLAGTTISQPGCEIVVPAKLKRKMTAAEMMSMGSSMSSIAAMIATISNIITK